MRRFTSLFLLLVLLVSFASAQKKKRVAILDFDYGTVRSDVASIFGTDQDVGKGIADMLVDRLVNDGTYSVIERKALNKILAEQNFSNSDRADPTSAAKIGKLLGVDAIVVGSITQFGRDDKSTTVGGGGAGIVGRHFGFGGAGVNKKEAKAVVQITARLVMVNTGEILASAQGMGTSKRAGTSLAGVGGGSGGGGGGVFDSHSSNFANTLIGEATNAGSNTNLPARKAEYSGLVADVSGNTLILNIGMKAGVAVGDKIEIHRAGRVIKDPATGKPLKTVTSKIGDATVTDVDGDSATVTYTGSGPAKVGDVAKTP